MRSLSSEQQALHALRRRVLGLWLAGLVAAILCTYGVVRGIMGPIGTLDKAVRRLQKATTIYAFGKAELMSWADWRTASIQCAHRLKMRERS